MFLKKGMVSYFTCLEDPVITRPGLETTVPAIFEFMRIPAKIFISFMIVGVLFYLAAYFHLREQRVVTLEVANAMRLLMEPEPDGSFEAFSTHSVPDWFAPYDVLNQNVFLVHESRRDQVLMVLFAPIRCMDAWLTDIHPFIMPEIRGLAPEDLRADER